MKNYIKLSLYKIFQTVWQKLGKRSSH